MSSAPLKVFCAYARGDSKQCEELKGHLAGLQHQGRIQFWYDQKITAGLLWKRAIAKNLDNADIILLLISSRFIRSRYCYNIEMKQALARQNADGNAVRVIPIIIRSCDWEFSPLNDLQALPSDGKAIFRQGNDPDDALTEVSRAIGRVVNEILEQRAKQEEILARTPTPNEGATQSPAPQSSQPPQVVQILSTTSTIISNQGNTIYDPSTNVVAETPNGNGGATKRQRFLRLLLALLIVVETLFILGLQPPSTVSVNIIGLNYTGTMPLASGSNAITVGVSDGNYAFDTQDAPSKIEAAQAFSAGKNIGDTKAPSWNALFTHKNLKDGESCIYAQDQTIKAPYFTVVAAVTLSRPASDTLSAGAGEEELQGICLKQMYYNDGNNGENSAPEMKMRVIVANIGARAPYLLQSTISPVVEQIKQIADDPSKNFIGVIGLPFSTTVASAMDKLNAAYIPVISPSASSSDFDARWPSYFHRVVSGTFEEGQYAAQFAIQLLQQKAVATPNALVFQANDESDDPYSTTLGKSFTSVFGRTGQTTPKEYDTSASDPFFSIVNQSTINNYNLIFCACFSDEFAKLDEYLVKYHYKGIIMGGEALYDLEGYPKDSQTTAIPTPNQSYKNIYLTSFAYPDEIYSFCKKVTTSVCSSSSELGTFYQRFCTAFDYDPKYKVNQGRACLARPESHLTLAYDATSALLKAYAGALLSKQNISPSDMKLDGVGFQGLTGYIQFKDGTTTSSNAENKVILALCADNSGQTHFLGYSNMNFFPDAPPYSQPPQLDPVGLKACEKTHRRIIDA